MKSIIKYKDGKDGWEIRETERKEPKDNEVEIQIKAAGICGSELHMYHDNHVCAPPIIVGHEFSGVISRVGKDITKWKVEDRVVSENNKTSCGECEYCKTGQTRFCEERELVGFFVDGGWTEYICLPAKYLLMIPEEVSYEEACMTEPSSIVVNALCKKAPIAAGETVLVQGCGAIGLLAAMTAKAAGASKVIITGTDIDAKIRLPIAKEIGIDTVINISKESLKERIAEITKGKGVDMVVEASGAIGAINEAISLVRKAGRIVAIGEAPQKEIPFKWNEAIFKACDIIFTFGASYEAWALSLQFMKDKKLNLKPLITHRLPYEKFHEGFALLESKQGVKVVLSPEL